MTKLRKSQKPGQPGGKEPSTAPGPYRAILDNALLDLRDHRIMSRLWAHDHTIWKNDPTEISNRLGWLSSAEATFEHLDRLKAFADEVRVAGYMDALLLGMGGSSLAPEVLSKTFPSLPGYLRLSVLDSTDPAVVLKYAEKLDPARTLVIVSSKSGTTVEVLSFFKYFFGWMAERVGKNRAGEHFIAITDPGSTLSDLARRYNFRDTFLNDPNIGGRYSALSFFGMVPAALIGVDVRILLERAMTMAENCEECNCPVAENNHGARLGAFLGALAGAGRDKLTLIASPSLASFGDWVEQLIAESTGKEGKGILPVVNEPPGTPAVCKNDRLFVCLELAGESLPDDAIKALEEAGHPVEYLRLRDPYDMGEQFFLWMMATAVAGYFLGINPFDQPDVEAAKILAREMVKTYKKTGSLPEEKAAFTSAGISVYGDVKGKNPAEVLENFLGKAKTGDYAALMAYVPPSEETDILLQILRTRLRNRYCLPVTVGYGPRFLHSTGQLHKGDGGRGLFIQFTADDERDTPIPDDAGSSHSSLSFGILKKAQAMGDRQALVNKGRRLIRLHLGPDIIGRLTILNSSIP